MYLKYLFCDSIFYDIYLIYKGGRHSNMEQHNFAMQCKTVKSQGLFELVVAYILQRKEFLRYMQEIQSGTVEILLFPCYIENVKLQHFCIETGFFQF